MIPTSERRWHNTDSGRDVSVMGAGDMPVNYRDDADVWRDIVLEWENVNPTRWRAIQGPNRCVFDTGLGVQFSRRDAGGTWHRLGMQPRHLVKFNLGNRTWSSLASAEAPMPSFDGGVVTLTDVFPGVDATLEYFNNRFTMTWTFSQAARVALAGEGPWNNRMLGIATELDPSQLNVQWRDASGDIDPAAGDVFHDDWIDVSVGGQRVFALPKTHLQHASLDPLAPTITIHKFVGRRDGKWWLVELFDPTLTASLAAGDLWHNLTFGDTDIHDDFTTQMDDLIVSAIGTPASSGTVTKVTVYANGPNIFGSDSNVEAAIYTHSGTSTLLGATPTLLVVKGVWPKNWHDVPFVSGPSVVASTQYNIAFTADENDVSLYADSSGGTNKWKASVPFGDWDMLTSSNAALYSAYATYEEDAGQTVTVAAVAIEFDANGLVVSPGAVSPDMAALDLASSPVSSTVIPGAVTIPAGTLDLTASLEATAIVPGSTSVSLGTIDLTGLAAALSVIPGSLTVPLNTLGLTGSAVTLTVAPGEATVSLSALGLTGSVVGLTIVPGSTSVILSPVSGTLSGESVSVIPGTVTIPMAALPAAIQAQVLTAVPGATAITVDALVTSLSADSAVVSPGAISVELSALTVALATGSIAMSPGGVTVALSALSATIQGQVLAIVPGARTLSMSSLFLAASVENVNPLTGLVVGLNALTVAGSLVSLSVLPGATSVSATAIVLAATPTTLVVAPGGVFIDLDTLTIGSTIGSLSVLPGEARLALATINAAFSAESVAVSPGTVVLPMGVTQLASSVGVVSISSVVRVLMGEAVLSATAGDVAILPGTVVVSIDALTLSAAVRAITLVGGFITAPDGRTFLVARDDRVMAIAGDARVLFVAKDDRDIKPRSDARKTRVARDDRDIKPRSG